MGDIAQQESGAGVRLVGLTDDAAVLEVGGKLQEIPLDQGERIIKLLSGSDASWFRLGVHVGMMLAG
ncbi:MAG: hypothetical protein K6L60_05555 [Oceanobacter sp.]